MSAGYERLWPLGANGTVDGASVVDNKTYYADNGRSMTHIINGMAGNIESHSTLGSGKLLDVTAVLDDQNYGFSKLTVHNATTLSWAFVRGDGVVGDELTLVKKPQAGGGGGSSKCKGNGKGRAPGRGL